MSTPLVEYPNAHATNPFYWTSGLKADAVAFCNAMATSYLRLNARREFDELFEAELVRLSPPCIPSRGPALPAGRTLCQVFAEEVTPSGKIQMLFDPLAQFVPPVVTNLGVFDRP